jgi:hypothetical protein
MQEGGTNAISFYRRPNFESLLTDYFSFFAATRGPIVLRIGSLQNEEGTQYISLFIYSRSLRPLPAVVTPNEAFVHIRTHKLIPRPAMPSLTV